MHGGCQPGMPVRKGNQPGSGCWVWCLHRAMVGDYRATKAAADEARKIAREQVVRGGNDNDAADFDAVNPPLTFKAYLVGLRDDSQGCRVVDTEQDNHKETEMFNPFAAETETEKFYNSLTGAEIALHEAQLAHDAMLASDAQASAEAFEADVDADLADIEADDDRMPTGYYTDANA